MRNLNLIIFSLFSLLFSCETEIAVAPEIARQMITHRNLGLGYLEENELGKAIEEFQALADTEAREPLGYANIGLANLRMGELEQAEKWLQEALNREPEHPGASLLMAMVYGATQRDGEAIGLLQNALKKHPGNVLMQYQLAQYFINSQEFANHPRAEEYMIEVVNTLPANVAGRLQLIELLLRNGKPGNALEQMEIIRQILPELPKGSDEIFQKSLDFMRNGNTRAALASARGFHNLMKATPFFQAAIAKLTGKDGTYTGLPIQRFSLNVHPPVQEKTGIPDALRFTDVTTNSGLEIVSEGETASAIFSVADFDSDGDQDIFVSRWHPQNGNSRQYLFVNENGKFSDIASTAGVSHSGKDISAIFADYDNDGYLDLFITNSQANKLYQNAGEGVFRDVTASTGIQTGTQDQTALFVDLDLEGDLDLFIAAASQNRLYRNNSDGTFVEIADESGIAGLQNKSRDAVFGDFDDDGDIDLFVVNEDASNRYYDNLRRSFFREISGQNGLSTTGSSGAIAAADYNNDGYLDLFITDLDGKNHSLLLNKGSLTGEGGTFEADAGSDSTFANIQGLSGLHAVFFDADNDGFQDLLIAGKSASPDKKINGLWLFYNNGEGGFLNASSLLPEFAGGFGQVVVADYDNDGDQDIFAAGSDGSIRLLRNDGGNINNYLIVRLAGVRTGSSKNNYFGIGAKLEVKAGTLYQMHVMNSPVAHFGLGSRESAEVVRIVWSNGVPQNRFNPERNQTIVESQILKGSCPWLFAWNGEEYQFVTDVLWTSALGMPLGIMGKEIGYAFPNASVDYMKIPGEMLQPKDGKYSLQFTSELWEAIFLDQANLIVVDHPDSIDIFVDEKFIPPPFPPLKIYSISKQQTPLSATDDKGNDLLPNIRQRDGDYISNLTPAMYQGIMEPHDLILNLGDLSEADSVFLFLHGWLFPTDASINVNIAQTPTVNSQLPSLQVIDRQGNWRTVIESFGFPKGKNKTVIVDLSGKFLSDDYRVRIRTSMQIYWDYIFYTTGSAVTSIKTVLLEAEKADLHFRGYSELIRKTPYSPHIPDYQNVTTGQKWRDLTGNYTRFGDVQPLLQATDNQYVIMNAGDEITLVFDAENLPELPTGWRREFLFYNTGWVKDGDLNTAYGQTVEPLPFHEMSSYPYSSAESYPQDEAHQNYLKTYNTRQITTEAFKRYLIDLVVK